MSVSPRHILYQGAMLSSLAQTAFRALRQKRPSGIPHPPPTPGEAFQMTVPPRPDRLIDDYIRHVGGDPHAYAGIVPFHLFPQWGFPLLAKTLREIPYDLTKVLNGGCRVVIAEELARGVPLQLRARLESVDADERRAILTQRLVTGTAQHPEALISEVIAFIPLRRRGKKGEERKEPPRVPEDAREVGRFHVGRRAGLDFAFLTGDFNPIHWIPAAARAAGQKGVILHGFSTMAHAVEILNRHLWGGDVRRLRSLDVRFTRPLLLPATPAVFISGGNELYVGDGPGAPTYLTGTYETR
ncbi:MAG: hypothetical protein D6812_10580 [Deltaproteobacteria bacterium]|nr:MAG: hypothetical protein D6812_10580 [Deltaproteobacteria bacterium]